MLKFILGGAGSGKSVSMINHIKKAIDDSRDILIIVPDQFSFEYDKKLYNYLGCELFNKLTVLSFSRVAEDIFLKYGGKSGVYADDIAKTSIMQLVLNELRDKKSLTYYHRQIKSSGFINLALDTVKELRLGSITPNLLSDSTKMLDNDLREKSSDIALIYSTYERLMGERNLKDSLTDISEASHLAIINNYFKGKCVFVDEFTSYTGDEFEMFKAIFSSAMDTYICLSSEDVNKKTMLFSATNETYQRLKRIALDVGCDVENEYHTELPRFLNEDIAHISKNVFRQGISVCEKSLNVSVIEAKNFYEEADFTASKIRQLINQGEYKYNEIAVVTKSIAEYSAAIENAFSRYEIPIFIDTDMPAANSAPILLIMGAIELATGRIDTEIILKYAKTQLLGLDITEVCELENYCYQWSIRGRQWRDEFKSPEGLTSDEFTPEIMRSRIIEPILQLREKCKNTTGEEICKNIYEFIVEIDAEKNMGELCDFYIEKEHIKEARELKQVWNRLMDIFDSLFVILGETPLTLAEFKDLFSLIISGEKYASPPQTLDSVIITEVRRARLNSPRVTFVLGANDGKFPSVAKPMGLFGERDKELLQGVGIGLSKSIVEINAEECFYAYASLSSPREKLFVSYSLSDISGKAMYPSRVVEQIKQCFANDIFSTVSSMGIEFFCSTLKACYYTYVQSMLEKNEVVLSLKEVLLESPNYREKVEYLDTIRFGTKHEIADKAVALSLFGSRLNVSATVFEDYNNCRFMYFCKRGLKAYPLSKKEFNALEKGNFLHECMERIFKECTKADEFQNLTADNIKEKVDFYMECYISKKMLPEFKDDKRSMFLAENMKKSACDIILHLQEELSQSKFYPDAFEVEINSKSGNRPISLKASNGARIVFSGKVDRVDIFEKDGKKYIRVVDYKTGKKVFSLKDVAYGINTQMLLYIFALVQKGGKYEGDIPSGVLYMPSGQLVGDDSLGRNAKESDTKNYKLKKMKMNGIILDNEDVINAMENGASGVYIPVKKNKNGEYSDGSLITSKALDNVRDYLNDLLVNMADTLYEGDIDASPFAKGQTVPCQYCDYITICGNEKLQKSRQFVESECDELMKTMLGGKSDKESDGE